MAPRSPAPSARFAWLNAIVLLLGSFVAVAWLTLQVRPGNEIVAVAFPPWWSAEDAMNAAASADAAIVRTTSLPTLLVLRPGPVAGWTRLRAAGAWFAIDPQAAAACFTESIGTQGERK
ncbi:hypothetical protein ACQR1I_01420 [Bradyrhizobium sp. HKCCYLS2038]|uniref:hypothetical protein n=1 Tax=unclassified Bradyrhizobium TaxID=2631580 RepID=UPI003EBB19A4